MTARSLSFSLNFLQVKGLLIFKFFVKYCESLFMGTEIINLLLHSFHLNVVGIDGHLELFDLVFLSIDGVSQACILSHQLIDFAIRLIECLFKLSNSLFLISY